MTDPFEVLNLPVESDDEDWQELNRKVRRNLFPKKRGATAVTTAGPAAASASFFVPSPANAAATGAGGTGIRLGSI